MNKKFIEKNWNLESWSVLGKILWLLIVKPELKPRSSDSGQSSFS